MIGASKNGGGQRTRRKLLFTFSCVFSFASQLALSGMNEEREIGLVGGTWLVAGRIFS